METKKIIIERSIDISGLTIIPVTQTVVHSWNDKGGSAFLGIKKPLYVIVSRERIQAKAFDMDGKEIGIDKIKEEYPELGIILRETERDF